ncbi:hypothetical protein D3C87_1079000 [compost metagenome]
MLSPHVLQGAIEMNDAQAQSVGQHLLGQRHGQTFAVSETCEPAPLAPLQQEVRCPFVRGLTAQTHDMVKQTGLLIATHNRQRLLQARMPPILDRQDLAQHQGVHAFDARHRHRRHLIQGPSLETDADRVPCHQEAKDLTPPIRQGMLPTGPPTDDQTGRGGLAFPCKLRPGGNGLPVKAQLANKIALILGQGRDSAQHPQGRDIGRRSKRPSRRGRHRRRHARTARGIRFARVGKARMHCRPSPGPNASC